MASFNLLRDRASKSASKVRGGDTRTAWHPISAVYDDGIIVGHSYRRNAPERWLYLTLPGEQLTDAEMDARRLYGERLWRALGQLYLNPEDNLAMTLLDNERSIHLMWVQWRESPLAPTELSAPAQRLLNEHVLPQTSYYRRAAYIGIRLNPDTDISLVDLSKQWVASLGSGVEAPPHERYEADENKVRSVLEGIGARTMEPVEVTKLLSWFSQQDEELAPHIAAGKTAVTINGQYKYRMASVTSCAPTLTPGVDTWMATAFNRGRDAPVAMSFKATLLGPDTLIKRLSKAHRAARSTFDQTSNSRDGEDSQSATAYFGTADLRRAYQETREPAFENVEIVAAVPVREGDDLRKDAPFTSKLSEWYGLDWSPMHGRQDEALMSMWPCSPVQLPKQLTHAVGLSWAAHMGFGDEMKLGDRFGAMMGRTFDGRPTYLNHVAAVQDDNLTPCMLIVGAAGSGKTMLAQWLAYQFFLQGIPGVYVNPKEQHLESLHDLTQANVASLSAAGNRPGALDFFTWAETKADAALFAFEYLYKVLNLPSLGPAEPEARTALQLGLSAAADAGVNSTGQAVVNFVKHEQIQQMFAAQWKINPMFRLAIGTEDAENIMSKQRDDPGGWTVAEMDRKLDVEDQTGTGVIARATMSLLIESTFKDLVRKNARDGRGAVLFVDEFANMLKDDMARKTFDKINRECRSNNIFPVFLSQYPRDFIGNGGVSNWQPSRILMLRQGAKADAEQAFGFIGVEPTQERVDSLMGENKAKKAIPTGYLKDVHGVVNQIEIGPIPPWFLAAASTNPEDIKKRRGQA